MEQNYDGYEELANAIILQAVEDYREACAGIREIRKQWRPIKPLFDKAEQETRKPIAELTAEIAQMKAELNPLRKEISRLLSAIACQKMRYKNGKLSKEQSQKKCETLTCDLHAARKKAQKIRDTLRADQARLKELNGIILPLRKQKQTLQAKMKPYAAMKKDVEDFLLGDWFRTLSRADGKELLRRLQEECRMQSPGSASGNAN